MVAAGWLTGGLTVLLILVAAKAHGRQVRLARLRLGIERVDFRGENGPVVEGLWRHDRIRFWVTFGVVAFYGTAMTVIDPLDGWPWYAAVPAWLAWAFAAGFVGAGLVAFIGQLRPEHGDPEWLGRENVRSAFWWLLVAAAAALVAWSVTL